jgi:hypothetical protein
MPTGPVDGVAAGVERMGIDVYDALVEDGT